MKLLIIESVILALLNDFSAPNNLMSRLGAHRVSDIDADIDKSNIDHKQQQEAPSSGRLWPSSLLLFAQANPDANRLYEDIMMSYNRFIRPVQNNSDTLVVKLGLKLSQLIDVVSGTVISALCVIFSHADPSLLTKPNLANIRAPCTRGLMVNKTTPTTDDDHHDDDGNA